MKKILFSLLGLFALASVFATKVAAAEEDLLTMMQEAGYPATENMVPKASIVMDAETGQLLWADNIDLPRDPASMTKAMVVYLTFEAISQGKISMDTEVVATENDQAIANIYAISNNKIVAGVSYSVRELLTMTLVPSSNVTTLMLAHLIHDGDDASFLDLMNQTAQELGMTNTVFNNASGAVVVAFEGLYNPVGYDHTAFNQTTAKDLALLTYYLIKKHPEVLEFTNKASVTVKEGTPYQETFETYNYSVPGARHGIEGVDGLKTGSSPSAAFNAIVTAKRGDVRLISVVLGVSDWSDQDAEYYRHYAVNTLLEKSFADYTREVIAPAGQQEVDGQKITTTEALYGMVKNGEKPGLALVNNRLQVAGSILPDSGVAAQATPEETTASTEQEVTKSSPKAPAFSISQELLLSILLPIGLVVIIGLAVFLTRPKKRKKVQREKARDESTPEEDGSYSRRNRRRK